MDQNYPNLIKYNNLQIVEVYYTSRKNFLNQNINNYIFGHHRQTDKIKTKTIIKVVRDNRRVFVKEGIIKLMTEFSSQKKENNIFKLWKKDNLQYLNHLPETSKNKICLCVASRCALGKDGRKSFRLKTKDPRCKCSSAARKRISKDF